MSDNGTPRVDPRPPPDAPNQTTILAASFSWHIERGVYPDPDMALSAIVTLDVLPYFELSTAPNLGGVGRIGEAQRVRVQQAHIRLVMSEADARRLAADLAGA